MDGNKVQLFEQQKVRSSWDENAEKWWFSVVDIIAVLTEQATPRGASNYWAKLKERLAEEGDQLLTNCQQLKMTATDGKNYNVLHFTGEHPQDGHSGVSWF